MLSVAKTCSKCSEVKPLVDFCRDSRNPGGAAGHCKSCERERARQRYERSATRLRVIAQKRAEHDAQSRVCSGCGEEKALGEFRRARRRCKACIAAYDQRRQSKAEYQDRVRALRSMRPAPVVPDAKVCGKCGASKAHNEFSKNSWNSDGLDRRCKRCVAEYGASYYQENRDRLADLARARTTTDEGREAKRVKMASWRQNNRGRAREAARKRAARQRATPAGKLHNAMSVAMLRGLHGGKGGQKWEDLVGYTASQLMAHLESQFLPGMTWANHGRHGWHVDHVVPLSAFNFSSPEHIDFRRCWALTNLQPLWAADNLRKHSKLATPFQPSLAI